MRARKNNRETKTEKRKTKKKEGNETESGAKAPTSNSELILDQKKNSELIMHQTVVLDQQVVRVVMDSGSLNNW